MTMKNFCSTVFLYIFSKNTIIFVTNLKILKVSTMIIDVFTTTTTFCSVKNIIQSNNTYSCTTADGDLYHWSDIFPDGIPLLYPYLNHILLISPTIVYLIYWPLVF